MKSCAICEKSSVLEGRHAFLRSHYNPAGKIRKYPNLQWARLSVEAAAKAGLPGTGRAKVCGRCRKKLRAS